MDKNILSYESVLPTDFDGTFKFTNWSDEDFIGTWGSKNYLFPAHSTVPMIIPEHTPLEVQSIRKKFAKNLAEREFSKSQEYGTLLKQERNTDGTARLNSFQQATAYSIESLTPYIQRCLEPLPVAQPKVSDTPRERLEDKLTRNSEGELNTQAIDKKISLKRKALGD